MELIVLFCLIRFLIVRTSKSDYRPSLDNYYSKTRTRTRTKSSSNSAKSTVFFPINETHRHFNALQNAKKIGFKNHVNFVFNNSQNLPKIIRSTDSSTLTKVMDMLSKSKNDELLEQRMVIYLNILVEKNYVLNPQNIPTQFKFIRPISTQVVDLLNNLEDKMILDNRIEIVRAITACKAQ